MYLFDFLLLYIILNAHSVILFIQHTYIIFL